MSIAVRAGAVVGLILTAPLALAADMPEPVPPLTIENFSWTGHYLGVHGGFGWGNKTWFGVDSIETIFTLNDSIQGWLGGVQAGTNWQNGNFVFGVEADFSGASIVGNVVGPAGTSLSVNADWLASATARLGLASNEVLYYFKGGAAWAHDQYTATRGATSISAGNWVTGWTVGGGAEWAFAPHWTLKAEYNYMDFGRSGHLDTTGLEVVPVPPQPPVDWDVEQKLHLIKIGLNYKF